MSITQMFRSPLAVLLTIISCVVGAPLQIDGENIGLGEAVYSQPELAEALARNYEGLGEPGERNLDAIRGGHLMPQSQRVLESGTTFGASKRFDPHRKQNEPIKHILRSNIMNRMQFDNSAKRNFDEIDRTNFDSFVKRNFDEIDRTGWNSFVKRRIVDAYLASKQR